jgi:sigma-54 dependent transcriptional regulator, acetoin dehydrogenase operon transcriptional activator AcoR
VFSARTNGQESTARSSSTATRTRAAVTFATLDTGDAQMASVLRRVEKVRGRDIPLLVLGKTGTGKEWLARAMHEESPRRDAPFVAVNCASLPDTLIEAELFGYEDGAFTGAKKRGSVGKIVQADGGTLFLDEIGDMPLAQQVRLMRVLQERSVVPLGGTRAIAVDLRIVCATHRNLRAMIDEGTFREDLYYRINGLAVTLPALAERSDLAVLVERILARLQRDEADNERMPTRVSARVMDSFLRCRWPGNLRQLSNVLRTAGIMAEGADEIDLEHLADDFLHDCESVGSESMTAVDVVQPASMEALQATVIEQALARHNGNVSAAARELGVARNTVYRVLRRRAAH